MNVDIVNDRTYSSKTKKINFRHIKIKQTRQPVDSLIASTFLFSIFLSFFGKERDKINAIDNTAHMHDVHSAFVWKALVHLPDRVAIDSVY